MNQVHVAYFLAYMGILTEEQLGFQSWTFYVPNLNHKLL